LILQKGSHLSFIDAGVIDSPSDRAMSERLRLLHDGLLEVIHHGQPDEAAIEETFVNKNPNSTLKLGMARGVAMLVPAISGLSVSEYPPNLVKKAVVGAGHAGKEQVAMMVQTLLPGCAVEKADALDALAVAICHAHLAGTARQWMAATAKTVGGQKAARVAPLAGGRLRFEEVQTLQASHSAKIGKKTSATKARGRTKSKIGGTLGR